jgi:hypothetical protein
MSENVYTVAPSISESSRVQMTSAPSAVMPDSAIVAYTGHASRGIALSSAVGAVAGPSCGVAFARVSPATATMMLRAIATYVATAMS